MRFITAPNVVPRSFLHACSASCGCACSKALMSSGDDTRGHAGESCTSHTMRSALTTTRHTRTKGSVAHGSNVASGTEAGTGAVPTGGGIAGSATKCSGADEPIGLGRLLSIANFLVGQRFPIAQRFLWLRRRKRAFILLRRSLRYLFSLFRNGTFFLGRLFLRSALLRVHQQRRACEHDHITLQRAGQNQLARNRVGKRCEPPGNIVEQRGGEHLPSSISAICERSLEKR